MHEREVEGILRWHNERWATPNRTAVLAKLTTIYEQNDVIVDGAPLALHRCCPSASECWAGEQDRVPRVFPACNNSATEKPGESSSIFWPWVGEQYRPGGVCLVSLNLNNAKASGRDWWTIGVEYAIAEHAFDAFEHGKRSSQKSPFAYRVMATAQAVLASRDGVDPVEEPAPQEAAVAYERVARIQAIKCSPADDYSRPSPAMRVNCPGRFARRELDVLAPGVIVAFGVVARATIGLLGVTTWEEDREHFHRGKLAVADAEVDAFALAHPTDRRGPMWKAGQAELVSSLRVSPLSKRVG